MTRPLTRTAAKRLRRLLAQHLDEVTLVKADRMLNEAIAWGVVVGEAYGKEEAAKDEGAI